MAKVEAVIFDLGRVLVDIKPDGGILAHFGFDPDRDLAKIISHPLFRRYNLGELNPQEYHSEFCALTGLTVAYEDFAGLWCSIFREMAGMEQLVADVASRVPVNLLSDTDPLHWGHITSHWQWIGQTFTNPALSYQLGHMKPDAACYLAAAEKIGVDPSCCIFIDDLQCNIDGAVAVGMGGSFVFAGAEDARQRLTELGVL